MTPGSRSSSGAEDKRAVPRSARAAAPGSGAASPGIRLRSRERRCVPWSGAAVPGAGLHPWSEAVSPGTRFHPRNQAATRRIGLHPPPSQTVSLGTGLLPWGWVLPQSRAASPGIRLHPGSRVLPPDRTAVPVPAAGSAGCGSRTHLPLGTPASPACRFPRIPGPPPAPPEGEEEDTDQHGPRRSGFSRPGRRGLQRRRTRAAAGARSRLGRSASPPRPGSRRWAAMARSAPPRAFGTVREQAWEGGAAFTALRPPRAPADTRVLAQVWAHGRPPHPRRGRASLSGPCADGVPLP